ncbi:MAG: hypothetical protein IKH88_04385, partial [Prevotella sp.]|nr:hypothetical protein [Prevotella sp.]
RRICDEDVREVFEVIEVKEVIASLEVNDNTPLTLGVLGNNDFSGLQILIFSAAGFQIRQNIFGVFAALNLRHRMLPAWCGGVLQDDQIGCLSSPGI